MSFALSSPSVFQRVDAAYRALMSNVMAKPSMADQASIQRQRPLRVVRTAQHSAGRMVISGRMADVCAELDRLIALENQRKAYSN
jgi:hypothetical protein